MESINYYKSGAQEQLITTQEGSVFEVLEVKPSMPVLLVCDHASRRIPDALQSLGVDEQHLSSHVAWDIGAGDVTRHLSRALRVPAVLAGYSRLVVDCNRQLDSSTAFPETSDGVVVPGNLKLDKNERQCRAEALYWPYHCAVRDQLAALETIAPAPALIAVHSFTPVFAASARPWHVGILWDQDPRIAKPLLGSLRENTEYNIGNNEPYSGKHPHDFTIDYHAEAGCLPNVSLEIRQDLINTDAGVERWSDTLAAALLPILSDHELYRHWSGSW